MINWAVLIDIVAPITIALACFRWVACHAGIAIFYYSIVSKLIREAFDVLTSDDEKRIDHWVSQFKLAGPLVLILVMIVQMFLFVVPNVFPGLGGSLLSHCFNCFYYDGGKAKKIKN